MTNERFAETIDKLIALFEPVLEREGLELVSLRVERDRTGPALRLAIDRAGRQHYGPGRETSDGSAFDGVTIEDCARAHRLLKAIIDGEGVITSDYSMEVSSPGVNRPLTKPAHFTKATGLKVRVKTRVPVAGASFFLAPLVSANDDGIVLDVQGEQVEVAYRFISKANVEYEF